MAAEFSCYLQHVLLGPGASSRQQGPPCQRANVSVIAVRGLGLSLHSQLAPEQAGSTRDLPTLVPQLLRSRSSTEPKQGPGESGNRFQIFSHSESTKIY